MAPLLTLIGMMALFGALNWLAGGNLSWRKRIGLPGRSIYYAGLIATVVLYSQQGWLGALIGLTFTLWRLPGWYGAIDAGLAPIPEEKPGQSKIFGIEVRPLRLRDFIVMSSRGLLAFPAFIVVAWMQQSAAPLIALCIASLLQGAAYDLAHRYLGRRNDWAEITAGMAWGAAYATLILPPH